MQHFRLLGLTSSVTIFYIFSLLVSSIHPALAFSGSGSGTSGDPFQITTCAQLQEMQDDLDAFYRLENDIDCTATASWNSGAGFAPVGPLGTPFMGRLDGQEFTISNLYMNRNTSRVALFGYIGVTGVIMDTNLDAAAVTVFGSSIDHFSFISGNNGGTIQNVHVTSSTLTADLTTLGDVGGLAGESTGTIQNSSVTAEISGNANVGGLVGRTTFSSNIQDSSSSSIVSGVDNVGGLVGYATSGTIQDSYSSSIVQGENNVGGLAGTNSANVNNSYVAAGEVGATSSPVGGLIGYNNGNTSNSYTDSSVQINSGTAEIGGLIGRNTGIVTNSYAENNINMSADSIGGLIGYNEGEVSNSHAIGNITATGSSNNIGGLIGENYGSVSGSYATGNTTGTSAVGGFIGNDGGSIQDSYARGNVTATGQAGGFIGSCAGEISNSFSTGNITASTDAGGFIGSNDDCSVENSFWDIESSGQSSSPLGTGKTTGEMQFLGNYSGTSWDITSSVTDLNNGYPYLSWQAGDSSPVWYILSLTTDADGDGTVDDVENSAPNAGDANDDGILDGTQVYVASFINSLTDEYVTLEVNSSCDINSTSITAESTNAAADSGYDYPAGMLNFSIGCGTPGFTATISQYYYGIANSGYLVRKYTPSTNGYSTVNTANISQVTIASQNVIKATYQVTDGGILDTDGTANGTIVDPVGIAISAVGVPNTGFARAAPFTKAQCRED